MAAHGRRSRIGAARQHHAECPAGSAALAREAQTPIAGDTADLLLRRTTRCECCASKPSHIGFRAVAEDRTSATGILPFRDGRALVRPVMIRSVSGFSGKCGFDSMKQDVLRSSQNAWASRDVSKSATDSQRGFACSYTEEYCQRRTDFR